MFKTGDIVRYENKYWKVTDLSVTIKNFQFKDLISVSSLFDKSGEITIVLTKAKNLKLSSIEEYLAWKILES